MKSRIRPVFELLSLGMLLALVVSCNNDFGGLWWSESTPDERFLHSRRTPDPVWTGEALGESFRLAFITDTHVEHQDLSRLQALLPALDGVSVILNGGDVTQSGSAADWEAWTSWKNQTGRPVYEVIGNHDLYFRGWNHLAERIPQTSYTLVLGSRLRLIFLDSGNATLGGLQTRWLKEVLAQAAEDYIFVITHHPLFSAGFSSLDWSDPQEALALADLFSKHGVDLVLAGHAHRRRDQTWGGVRFLVGDSFRVDDPEPTWIHIEVGPGGVQVVNN